MFEFNTIEEVVQDLREGRIIIMTDDPERENEGDLICAAEFATKYNVNYGDLRERSHLYADERCYVRKARIASDGGRQHGQSCHRFYCLHRSCGHHDGYFGCGTFLYRGQVCG